MSQTILITPNRPLKEMNAELAKYCKKLETSESEQREASEILSSFHQLALENSVTGQSLCLEKVILEGRLKLRATTRPVRKRRWKQLLNLLRLRHNH